jgi:hypothetical protein
LACTGQRRKVWEVLVGKLEGKTKLGRPRRRWEDGLKMDLRKISWEDAKKIHLDGENDRWQAVMNT